jgi:hypothetical protein
LVRVQPRELEVPAYWAEGAPVRWVLTERARCLEDAAHRADDDGRLHALRFAWARVQDPQRPRLYRGPRNGPPCSDVVHRMRLRANRAKLRYLEPGRRRRLRRPRMTWLLVLVAALLMSFVWFAHASASGSEVTDCPYGAISAIGPIDAQGRGDTTPDVACIDP